MCIKGSPSKGGDIYVISIQSIPGAVDGFDPIINIEVPAILE
jgi:hypothetical protein